MIKDPPLLRVRRNFPRPSEAVLRALRSVPTGFIVDCMNGRGALDYRIKPLDPNNCKFVAPIVTCHPGPGDNLAVFAALEIAQPGDAIFIATDTFTRTAIAGDIMIAMGRNRGVAGFVTDGLMRDIDGILPVGLPAFCMGITPNSCTRNGPGTAGMPVVMGGPASMQVRLPSPTATGWWSSRTTSSTMWWKPCPRCARPRKTSPAESGWGWTILRKCARCSIRTAPSTSTNFRRSPSSAGRALSLAAARPPSLLRCRRLGDRAASIPQPPKWMEP